MSVSPTGPWRTIASRATAFDGAGNLTADGTRTYLYTENRLSEIKIGQNTTTVFGFDGAKRWRLTQGPPANPDALTFSYTGTGRLATYGDETQGLTATYSYDAAGQRRASVVAMGSEETTTGFTYVGLLLQGLSATKKTGGTPTAGWTITYLYDEHGRPYGGYYRDTLASPPATPVFFAMVLTDRGDVVELLDKNGYPFAAYRYDAWGNPLGTGTDGVTGVWWKTTDVITDINVAKAIAQRQALRYASYCFDSESGMYYLSSRHYDPATRQFLSKDLSRNDGEQSAYQYCLGNPVKYTDPTGYRPYEDADAVAIAQLKKDAAAWAAYARGWANAQAEIAAWRQRNAVQICTSGTATLRPATGAELASMRYVAPDWHTNLRNIAATMFFLSPIPVVLATIDAAENRDIGEAVAYGLLAVASVTPMGRGSGLVSKAVTRAGTEVATEGIYWFKAASGFWYVGQSGNIPARIAQHLGIRLLPEDLGTVRALAVAGGKTEREIMEHLKILEFGGVDVLENIRYPIGAARADLLTGRSLP